MDQAPRSLNVSLEPVERRAVERLHEQLRKQDAIKYRHLADVVRDLIRERMVREFGPGWEAEMNGRAA